MDTIEVKFYEKADDRQIKFVVIACRYNGRWVLVKHKERDTYEIPGGHREPKETVDFAAERELVEETGAKEYTIKPVSIYSVIGKTRVNLSGSESFGMLYIADIKEFGEINSEIEMVNLFESLPQELTYPQIQPRFIELIERLGV